MNNKILVFFAVLLTLTLFPFCVNALQYDYSSDNGEWLQYTSGLSFDYYSNKTAFSGSDWGFGDLPLTDFAPDDLGSTTEGEWSFFNSILYATNPDWEMKGSTSEYAEGEKSFLVEVSVSDDEWNGSARNTTPIFQDSNISFKYKYDEIGNVPAEVDYGYADDSGNTTIGSISLIESTSGWVEVNYSFSEEDDSLKYFWVNFLLGNQYNSSGTGKLYFDDVKIKKNNVGTFRVETEPEYCNSINACSNVTNNLPSSNRNNLYWIVDYYEDANCIYYKDDDYVGEMIEGTNGLYYAEVGEYITSGGYADFNLSATCDKIPYNQKSFFVTPLLYKYGLLNGGSFESDTNNFIDDCSEDFCSYYIDRIGGEFSDNYDPEVENSSSRFFEGQYSLKSSLTGSGSRAGTNVIYYNEYNSGETIYLKYLSDSYSDGGSDYIKFGYIDDSNSFVQDNNVAIPNLNDDVWYDANLTIPEGNYKLAIQHEVSSDNSVVYFDVITSSGAKAESSLSADNNLTENFGQTTKTYNFTSEYLMETGSNILGADCNLSINGTDYSMSYDSNTGLYEYSTTFINNATYSIEHSCYSSDYSSQTKNYNVMVVTPASQLLTIGDKVNIGSTSISNLSNDVNIIPNSEKDAIEWSVVSAEPDYDVDFTIINNILGSKQYYIYSSDDGEDYVLSDTLTYGEAGDYNSCLQKIRVGDSYYYTFTDTIDSVKKYYKLVYRNVGDYWKTIGNSTDWVNVNDPQLYEDSYEQEWDLFSDSNYSEIDSYTKEKYPLLTSDDLNTGFEFQFTAYASSATDIIVGYEAEDGNAESVTFSLSTKKTRYSIPIDPTSERSYIQINTDVTEDNRIYLSDYALIPKSYFIGRLQVYEIDGSVLDAININGTSKEYLEEATPFIFKTSALDLSGNFNTLRIEALFDDISVKTYEYELDKGADYRYSWNEIIEGVVDLEGTYKDPSDLRDVLLKATIIDDEGNEVAEQTKEFNLLQYPFYADDLELQLFSVNNKVGDNPTFEFNFSQKNPERFLGMEIKIYDENNSRTSPNYEDVIYADELGCDFDCSKALKIENWVWEKSTLYNVDVMLLVNTENKDYTNDLTYKKFSFRPTYRKLDTARILQVYERTDFTYRNDEDIPLVLQLRDVPYRDLSKEYSVYLNVDLCNTEDGSCYEEGTTKFNPAKHIYDKASGHNYYYFDNLFYTDDGELLPDGNYIRFEAFLDEKTDAHTADLSPTLAAKCGTYGDSFLNGIFSFDFEQLVTSSDRLLYGCQVDSNNIIEIGNAEEQRVFIQEDHNVIGGQNQSVVCLNTDNNNNYVNNLEQELDCVTFFQKSEQSIDNFTIYLGNENSDFSKDSYEGQYIKFDIPSEYIIFNDPLMLKQTLNVEYQTDEINTIGELGFYFLDEMFSGVANPVSDVFSGVGEQTGLITNYNFDMNFDKDLSPNYVNGVFGYKLKGVKVINQYDYLQQYPKLETQDPRLFTKWALRNGVPLPKKETTIEVYSSTGKPIIKKKILSNIVIYKEPSRTAVEQQTQEDSNTSAVIPTILKFNIIQDMLSNSETEVDRAYLPLTFNYLVPDNRGAFQSIIGVGNEFLADPIKAGFKYWFWFVIGAVIILGFAKVVSLLKGNGGTTIINNGKQGSG